jgi:hypothetical protein
LLRLAHTSASRWLAVLALLSLQACASVQPWERELHAQRRMQVSSDPECDALDQHVYEYREGASGGYSAHAASGCGCN